MTRPARLFLPLLTLLSLLLLTACGGGEIKDRTYDEAVVLTEAQRLLRASEKYNQWLYGEGVPYQKDAPRVGAYAPADPAWTAAEGFSLSSLRASLEKIFSAAQRDLIEKTVLSPVHEEGTPVTVCRYYEREDGVLMVHTAPDAPLRGEAVCDTDGIRVEGVFGEVLTLTVPVTVSWEGQTQTRTLKFRMIEEADGWKLHSPTYMTYDPNADAYAAMDGNE